MSNLPDTTTPIIDNNGRLNPFWLGFIIKQIGSVDTLATDASLTEVIAKINELITAAKNAKVMK